jgi:ParB family transcriptional regulator, chromosome partitioning protein
MAKRRALGRGLESLIPATEDSDSQEGGRREGGPPKSGLHQVAVEAIRPNPQQPRGQIEPETLSELADSIREHGLIQPLVVHRVADGDYTLIAGERRWRAARQAGLDTVPVVIREASPQDMLEMALVENIQRADLNALEEAHAYRHLMDDFGLTQEQVAQRVGKSRPTVANMVRLLRLPPEVQAAVAGGRLDGAHARALLPLAGPDEQIMVMEAAINQAFSVRQVEAVVALPGNLRAAVCRGQITEAQARALLPLPTPEAQELLVHSIANKGLSLAQVQKLVEQMVAAAEGQPVKKDLPRQPPALSPEMADLVAQFERSLGAEVRIRPTAKGGQLIIHYYSDEELQAIYEAIVGR